jgi:hypothetical protein
MKKILFAFSLALLQVCAFAQTPFTAPWGFNYSAPTGAPSALGTRVRFDITTGRIYTWSPDALNWQLQGYTIDQISGTSAPAYAPVRGQSWFAVNGDTLPRLYQYTGSGTVWKCLNCSDGKTYTAGTGITLSGANSTVINNAGDLSATNELNTGFDISGGNLRIIDAGATRTVAVTSIAPDQSVTNELQTIDTFLVSGSNLLLSLTQDNQPAKTITLPASGITILTGDVTATGPGSAVATIAAGVVTGAKLAANSVDSTKITPLSIANSDIANVAPEKLLQKGASTGQVLGWNGSIWGPTAAGITGSGLSGQVGYFSGTSTLSGSNNLFWDNANIRLGIGGASSSSRLQITGGGTTSVTSQIQTFNSAGSQIFLVRDDGAIRLSSTSTGFTLYPYGSDPLTPSTTGRNIAFFSNVTTQGATGLYVISGPQITATGTATTINAVFKGFSVSSGSGEYTAYATPATLDQSGTATGVMRMFHANPNITNAVNLRAFDASNNVGYGLYASGANASNYIAGTLGVGTTSATSRVDALGANGYSQLRLRTTYTPTSTADALGNVGDIAHDVNYIYVKTSAGWKRAALSTF